jgi:hypothetical protein
MIGFTPAEAEKDILKQIRRGSDLKSLLGGLNGDRSMLAVNHLLQYDIIDDNPDDPLVFLISEFVIRVLSEKCTVEFLREALGCPLSRNPSFDGWLFEFDFLIHVRHAQKSGTPLMLFDHQSSHTDKWVDWNASRCITFKKENASDIALVGVQDYENIWLLPEKWNQGCYDAVQLLSNRKVRTVQVTRGSTHTIKFQYITSLFYALERVGFIVSSLEIAFVIPHGSSKAVNGKFQGALPEKWSHIWNSDCGYDKSYNTKEGYYVYSFRRTTL